MLKTGYAGNSKLRFPAKIENGDYQIRLKGDQKDHYDTEQFSLRITNNNDSIGEVYSLQHPKTRNYINEWIFQEFLKENHLAYLEYDFVEVLFNGQLQGTYAYEQHLSHNNLLQSEGFKRGPIVSFDDDNFWKDASREERDFSYDSTHYLQSPIRIYNKDELDPSLIEEAKTLLKSYQLGQQSAKKVFNLKNLARYYALCDVNGARHGLRWINLVFHYNPENKRFSPVGFDSNSGESWGVMIQEDYLNPVHHEKIFTDSTFNAFYKDYLIQYSSTDFLDTFLENHRCKIQNFEKLIQKNSPEYKFSDEYLQKNLTKIKKYLEQLD